MHFGLISNRVCVLLRFGDSGDYLQLFLEAYIVDKRRFCHAVPNLQGGFENGLIFYVFSVPMCLKNCGGSYPLENSILFGKRWCLYLSKIFDSTLWFDAIFVGAVMFEIGGR